MTLQRCRLCRGELPAEHLLVFPNMPKSAQFFPTEETVSAERGVDIILKQCPFCGLVQATGTPVSYYRDVIRAAGVSEAMREFRRGQFREWVLLCGLRGRKVLEVGCGRGEYMELMEAAGAAVCGVEHGESAVKAGRAAGHRIFRMYPAEDAARVPEAPYDGFYCLNFLEHSPDPSAFLRGIGRNLASESYGLVEVPNFSMMLEKSLYSEFIQDHLSYFTLETLRTLLALNGFEVLSAKSVWYDYILSAVVRLRKPMDLSGMTEKRASLKRQVDSFFLRQQQSGKKVAVWGAGHQGLANLSLLELSGRVEYVVDSADFKQGKYTPATHIPIVSPGRLQSGDVQTVLIMAAGYSEEVNAVLERDFPSLERWVLTADEIRQLS